MNFVSIAENNNNKLALSNITNDSNNTNNNNQWQLSDVVNNRPNSNETNNINVERQIGSDKSPGRTVSILIMVIL